MTRQTPSQRRSLALQGIVAWASLTMLGIAVAVSRVDLGVVEIARSPVLGMCIAIAGAAFVAREVVVLERLRASRPR